VSIEWQASDQAFKVLADKLDNPAEVIEAIAVNMAEEARNLVLEGHENGTAPDGSKWAPKVDGEPSHLVDNSDLRGAWHLATERDGFTISNAKIYASVHQNGATIRPRNAKRLAFKLAGGMVFARKVRIPARPMVPDEGEMPAKWAERFTDVAEEILDEVLGR
jgi:phage gpG-like protein